MTTRQQRMLEESSDPSRFAHHDSPLPEQIRRYMSRRAGSSRFAIVFAKPRCISYKRRATLGGA